MRTRIHGSVRSRPRRHGLVAIVLLAILVLTACGESASTPAGETTAAPNESTDSGASGNDADGAGASQTSAPLPDCPASDIDATAREDGLPALTLQCLGSAATVNLAGLEELPAVVNVWASWCPPCRAEIPAINEFAVQAEGVVEVLGIAVSDDATLAGDLWAEAEVRYPSVLDPDSLTRAPLRWIGPPVTYFVDSQGVLVARVDGAVENSDQLWDLAELHLGVQRG